MRKSKLSPGIVLFTLINFVGLIVLGLGVWNNRHSFESFKEAQSPQIVNATFSCDDNKTIQALFFGSTVELDLSDGRNLMLMQAVSGSGTRYTNGDESITFWNEGNTAFIEENNNQTYQNCTQTSK